MTQTFLDASGMTVEMRRRWRGVMGSAAVGDSINRSFTAQGAYEANADFRPTGKVFITRGYLQRRVTDPNGPTVGVEWRAEWDEKYTWGGMPGQVTARDPNPAGHERDPDFRDPVELPHVKSISINNAIDSGGVGTATITIANIKHEENTGIGGFVYHVMREAFYSPFRNGDDEFDIADLDLFLGRGPNSETVVDENGKVITGLVMPNRRIEVFQGYGSEIQRTFTGLIDSVEVNARTGELTISASDHGRVLAEATYNQFTTPPGRYPVAFIDWRWVRGVARTSWVRRFNVLKTSTPVTDITHIVGRICGWAGFKYWNRVTAGRIGRANTGSVTVDGVRRRNRAVFTGEGFDKGDYFMDGVNKIRELLGYLFFITPDIHPDSPNYGRTTDPNVYDDEYSADLVGMPNFVPPNVWNMNPSNRVEQFKEDEIIIDGSLAYDHTFIKKNIYVTNTGLKNSRGGERVFGYHTPYELDYGLSTPIYINFGEEYGENFRMTQKEIQVFMRVIMLKAMIQLCRGSFTVAGWPGATLNKQIDILESKTGTWRRFYVTGYEHRMELGEKASWTTNTTVVNIDNIYIERIKRQIKRLLGVDQDTQYDLTMTKPASTVQTPAWINKPQRGTRH